MDKERSLHLEAAGRLLVPLCVPSLLQGNPSVLLLCQPGSRAGAGMGFPTARQKEPSVLGRFMLLC